MPGVRDTWRAVALEPGMMPVSSAPGTTAVVELALQVACNAENLPDERDIEEWLGDVLAAVPGNAGRAREIGVRIVADAEGRDLNRRYRGHDSATNVLSFPAAPADAFTQLADDEPLPLGDLVLCAPVITREAGEQGKPERAHWQHLLVHGALHLLGYDHATDAGAADMEALEIRLLAARGVDNPYRGRESPG
ncbi:MAG: rRNA maturation RNase YbeY [Woeseia sp.]